MGIDIFEDKTLERVISREVTILILKCFRIILQSVRRK